MKRVRFGGRFICIICGSNFTRAEGVNFHFERCVERFGNPAGNSWNDHPSCASRRNRIRLTTTPTANATTDLTSKEQPPISKKQRATSPRAGPSSVAPSRRTPMTRRVLTRQQGALPISSRMTRSEAAQRASEARLKPVASQQAKAKPAKTKPVEKQPKSKPQETRKQKPQRKRAAGAGRQTKFHIADDRPPQSDLGQIFYQMVLDGRDSLGLETILESLSNKQINVATMCSGTESPLLALDLIQKGKR